MRLTPPILASLLAVALGLSATAAQADPWKDESGHGRGPVALGPYGHEESHGPGGYKHEWRSGNCKYEYKEGPYGVKEEYECHGHGRHAGPPAWTPPARRHHRHHDRHTHAAPYPPPPPPRPAPGPSTARLPDPAGEGRYCREYTAQSTVGGETVQTYGTACLRPDGDWEIVSQEIGDQRP